MENKEGKKFPFALRLDENQSPKLTCALRTENGKFCTKKLTVKIDHNKKVEIGFDGSVKLVGPKARTFDQGHSCSEKTRAKEVARIETFSADFR